jgi:acyl-CoA synthetase (AMP-forming)/AMP-acid ligase II/thioesterase domain-containing protein
MRKPWSTIRELVAAQAHARPKAAAILAPDRSILSFAELWNHVQQTGEGLRALGVRRGDNVASVLPNGPDAASTVLAVSSVATLVPLNPDATKSEYDLLLFEVTPKLLLVPAGKESTHPAAISARILKIPVVGVVPCKAAGWFTLEGRTGLAGGSSELPEPDDFAYILTTSGPTKRPKLIPMTHRAACLAASISASSMRLTSADRSLNISPLFHSFGLVSGQFATLSEGGSVVCLPGFRTTKFFDELVEFQATCLAAGPTVLRSIAERAPAHREKLERARLRVIRVAGPAPAPNLLERVERDLRATIVHGYGMSEAPCIASEQYPVMLRKPGSVGRASHQDVAIVDENGRPAPAGSNGEIALRGPWIFPGYYRNRAASIAAFDKGWFHTGDVGYFDAEGFLFLTDRCKEFIHRGGEKVSPVEVDEVLLSHPAVVEAVTFAIPDARFGEEIAAAVVLRSEHAVSAAALQEFAGTHLTTNNVPCQIVFVKQLPKGPTGKLSRFRMATELGLDRAPEGKARVGLADSAEVYPLQPMGTEAPFFLVAPGLEARALGKHLGPDRPVFGVRVPNLEHRPPPHSVERLAAECVRAVRRFRPSGPYALGGWCTAGVIAFEMARQLEDAGEHVALVALLDVRGMSLPPMPPGRRRLVRAIRLAGELCFRLRRRGRIQWLRSLVAAGERKHDALAANVALRQYRPHPWSGRTLHFWAAERPCGRFLDPVFEWNHLSPGGLEFHEVPGDHFSMLREPNVAELAGILAAELDQMPVHAG